MKKYLVTILAAAILFLFSVSALYGGDRDGEKNRFQLFNAEYRSTFVQTSKTTGFDEKKLFKIDTKTGATWMLIDVMLEGKDRKYWKKIKEETN